MRIRWLIAPLVAVLLTIVPVQAVLAQGCDPNGPLADMAGTYVSAVEQMRVEIYSCDGMYVQWDNLYGTHAAAYVSTGRLPGGGVVAEGRLPDPSAGGYLDGSRRIGFKPAEPGWMQVLTIGPYDETVRAYRLRKIL